MERRPWLIDEIAHAGAEHMDIRYAEAFDHKSDFDPAPDLARLTQYGLGPGSILVDVGAGTGEFAIAAAGISRRVVAVDVSGAMLERLRVKSERRGVTNLEVVRQGFLTYQHQGEYADFVYSKNALHHLPDFWKAIALQRIAAILKPGGYLHLRDLVYSFDPNDAEGVIEAWLRAAPANPEYGWTRAELEVHVRDEYSTYSWLLEPMLRKAGFGIREATFSGSRVFAAYTCVKG